MSSKSAGRISIDLVLGTGNFTPAADRAQAKINQLGGALRGFTVLN